MIVCPLNLGECVHFVVPKPRTVLIMAPSRRHQTPTFTSLLHRITDSLSKLGFISIEGASIVRHGDYLCSICQEIQSCAFGVAVASEDMRVGTLGNIYMEAGLMLGLGKQVILFVDKRKNLPSDFIRDFCVHYKSKDYLSKYRELLSDINNRIPIYFQYLARYAARGKDYEKAFRYHEGAYLINGDEHRLQDLETLMSELSIDETIPDGFKKRLLEKAEFFCSEARKSVNITTK